MTDIPPLPGSDNKDDFTPILENKFIHLIETGSGIVFDDIKRRELKRNVAACMQEAGENSFHAYYDMLAAGGSAGTHLKKLINFITINETFFFRVEEHFQILRDVAAPTLSETKFPGGIVNVWSAGVSSGEEVYSILITLLEIPGFNDKFRIRVLGTDINENMLYIAENAIYSGRTLDKTPPAILHKYFVPFKDRYRVCDSLRKMAQFRYLNLVEPFNLDFFGRPDIIFFRNVLIYFSKETTRRIIARFHELLNPGGYLFLGPSETLWNISDQFQLLMFDRAYIYRKPPIPGLSSSTGVPGGKILFKENFPAISPPSVYPAAAPPPKPDPEKTEALSLPTTIPSPTSPLPQLPQDISIFPSLPSQLRVLEEEATLALQLADYRRASELIDELLVHSSNAKAPLLLKMTLLTNLADEKAILSFVEHAATLHPIFPELLFLLGQWYESTGNTREAEKEYRKILFLNQELLPARTRLLTLLNNRGDPVQARREAKNILEQIESGAYADFTIPAASPLNLEFIKKTCIKILS